MQTAKKILHFTRIEVKMKHDKGTTTITTAATGLEEAKQIVLRAENAPESAVLSVKVAKPSIYQIKRLTAETSPFYFSRKTLKFFNQKLSDFSVTRYGNDKFKIEAKGMRGKITSTRIFNPFTCELEHPNP